MMYTPCTLLIWLFLESIPVTVLENLLQTSFKSSRIGGSLQPDPGSKSLSFCYIFTFNRDFRFTALPFTVYPAGCLIVIKTMAEGPFNSNVRSVRSSAYNDFPAPFRNGFDFHGEWHPQGHRALAVLLLTLSHCSLLYAVQRV